MTPEGLRELIAAGESLDLEFEAEESRPIDDTELVEAVVCLANWPSNDPGMLRVGVEFARMVAEESQAGRAGLVEPRGERKGRTWHLSAATYRRLSEPAAYVRQRGFETLQQEQMVLQYVETHGRITRREAAELCQLSGPQAYRLLQRLVEKGLLQPMGERGRGAKYARIPK
ncbi:MAG: hypothetical protein C4340_02670 [Armatimonadota bacterium]